LLLGGRHIFGKYSHPACKNGLHSNEKEWFHKLPKTLFLIQYACSRKRTVVIYFFKNGYFI
jgi:hypothetical protein